uniref:NACHT domain-containing protein n=1 Tax=Oreochromis aureus TaxID=47969 RepID=A0AAZ1XM09_OREAU
MCLLIYFTFPYTVFSSVLFCLSYLKYIRGICHLVGELKNLSVILENLYQREVLCDEEVSKIQAEKDDYDKSRTILDSVTKKGEKACYEFLKIIDMTRKRTLERPPLHPGTKTFDLHHWISCFSFKEDTQMNANYLQDIRKIKSCLEETRSLICRTQHFELLETDKNILLVGKPGIGKTALTHEMLRLWAERESKELDYMFYFDMRETSDIIRAKNLEELLFGVFCEPDEGKDEVLQDIKRHSDNVIIIFDGITNLSSQVVKKVLTKKLLPLAKIIITCRPDDEDEDFLSGDFDRVEVKGFSEQTIKTYLSATLGEDQKKVLSNLELVTLCHVPMYALMIAACFKSEDFPQPCTITEIYINIVRFCLQINSKTKNKDLNLFISTKKEEILSLAEVAFLATQQKSVNLTNLPCKDSCVLSFLKPLLIKEAPTETITTYAFLHYTVQEFFAALWILKNPDKIRDVFQQSGPLPRQLWEIFLINEEQMNFVSLLSLDGNLHLLVDGEKKLFERAAEVMQRMHTKVNVCLHWDKETPACHSQCESLLKALPFISSLRYVAFACK